MSKRAVLGVIVVVIGFQSSCRNEQIDIDTEKGVIKAVIHSRLSALVTLDYNAAAAVWAHEPYIVRENAVGWDSVSAWYEDHFIENIGRMRQEPDSYYIHEFSTANFDIHINGNFASAFYDEYINGIWDGEEYKHRARRHHYLEKIEGEWKIIAQLD